MDEIDLAILQQLFLNSRITNRELTDLTGLSVSAIHKRLKSLEDDHIISCYTARPSIMALNSIPVVVIGRSKAKAMDKIQQQIGELEQVFAIALGSAKVMYISVMLRNIGELQLVGEQITRIGQLKDPIVGIVTEPYATTPISLSDFELKILRSLNRDARKSLIDIADELGSSTKTVRRYLDKMIKENKVNFSIEWAPLYRDSFISVLHIETKSGANINKIVNDLYEKYMSNIVICVGFSNVPNFVLLEIWTPSPRESQSIIEELQQQFVDVVPYILMSISWYRSWLDDILK